MNLINLNNYLNLINSNDNFQIYLEKELVRGDVIAIRFTCTFIPRCIIIYQNKCKEFILEVNRNELDTYFSWLYKVLNFEYITTRDYDFPDTFHVKVYRVSIKD